MTRIYKQRRNISEIFIFVRENILKSDLIYLLRQDQRCYVYVFMFFLSVQAFFYPGQIWTTGRRKHNSWRYVFYVFKVSRAAYVNRVI
jgi:hypothetical protein